MNYSLTIQPSTTEPNATAKSYDIGRAVVRQMIVHIPDGHKYLTHFQVTSKGKRILPEFGSGSDWVEGNNHDIVVNFPIPLALDGPPYEMTLRGYNDDDTYPHSFYLEVN